MALVWHLSDEILLQIVRYLEPWHIAKLQLVSRKLRALCLDNDTWKRLCLRNSPWYRSLPSSRRCRRQELQDMASWDPAYPGEHVSWYDEYRQRHGPVCINWLQNPPADGWCRDAVAEARGLALYTPYGGDDGLGTMLAVSPLDDGSVCLWDVRGTRAKQGAIFACSKPGILTLGGQGDQTSSKVDNGVIECVAVDSNDHRAFFAVGSREHVQMQARAPKTTFLTVKLDIVQVDLHRLHVASRQSFDRPITTLSTVNQDVPITVGTSQGLHLYDFRDRTKVFHDMVERLDGHPPSLYAPLPEPTPINILHLPRLGSSDLISDDMYVSGRFSNILHYDRRKFPSVAGSIHSGASIMSLASLPFVVSIVDVDMRRQGELSAKRVARIKATAPGQSLIAGGCYGAKGSLEIYGLSMAAETTCPATPQSSVVKNRQKAASATILSVINHRTKIVFSDGAGYLKWFERDGLTECRRVKIGHSEAKEEASLFASEVATGDLARKIVTTRPQKGRELPNDDNILFWTGEKLGMASFTSAPLFKAKDFAAADGEQPTEEEERQQRMYKDRMRRALAWQADEVRFMASLGIR